MASKSMYPVSLAGSVTWLYPRDNKGDLKYETVHLKKAIFRAKNEFVIEFDYNGSTYAVIFQRETENQFSVSGTIKDGNRIHVRAICKVYSDTDGFALVGDHWIEDSYESRWFAELLRV